jgi:DnaJ-class molecular chaperone
MLRDYLLLGVDAMTETCGTCGGAGRFTVNVTTPGGWYDCWTVDVCPNCKGTGKVAHNECDVLAEALAQYEEAQDD